MALLKAATGPQFNSNPIQHCLFLTAPIKHRSLNFKPMVQNRGIGLAKKPI